MKNNGFIHKIRVQRQKFPVGEIVATAGVMALAEKGVDLMAYLKRHVQGDWGDLDDHDKAANDDSLKYGGEWLLSSYEIADHGTIWIITEADRSKTTLLLPDEY
jgi:hypothetical protein